jgi:glycosyltransferase involved in cell wall biosynthesis
MYTDFDGKSTHERNYSEPLVSVIVTCYNQSNFIRETIESVLSQTYKNIECIVVDDGSSDSSAKEVQKLQSIDNRIHFLRQNNQGVSVARNNGFRRASGSFIQFLDGDDLLKSNKIERHLVHFNSEPSIGVSYGQHEFYHVNTGKTSRFGNTNLDRKPLNQMLTRWFDGASLPIHSGLFRRSIWSETEVPFIEDYTGRCEDWVFLVNVALRDVEFSKLPDVLCVYKIGTANFTEDSLSWNIAALKAARRISKWLASPEDEIFLDDFSRRTLQRFIQLEKPNLLRSSWNWRIAYYMTRPFFVLTKGAKKWFTSQGKINN